MKVGLNGGASFLVGRGGRAAEQEDEKQGLENL
jgi:hypothetical protein